MSERPRETGKQEKRKLIMSQQPENFSDRILLCLAGQTPAVITETFYALAVAQKPPFVPNKIVVITTAGGEKVCKPVLADQIKKLCEAYDLDSPAEAVFEVFTLEDGTQIEDVRLRPEINATENKIFDVVRTLTNNENCAIHASLAGGRKTMSAHLQSAMQIYGRRQDRLSHVLVNPVFEGPVRNAYFPTKPPTPYTYKDRQGATQSITCDQMDIDLGYVDFISLRDGLPKVLLNNDITAQQAIAVARGAFEEPRLELDWHKRMIKVAGLTLDLGDNSGEYWVYAWFCYRCKFGKPPLSLLNIPKQLDELMAEIFPFVVGPKRRKGLGPRIEKWIELYKKTDFDWQDTVRQRLSRANKELEALGAFFKSTYRIHSTGKKPTTSYALSLAPSNIVISPALEFPDLVEVQQLLNEGMIHSELDP
jgi:CRISPR-associated protein (TIGR02584 family)